MQPQEASSKDTHNLLLSKFINNEQTKHVAFMKLDSHKALYKDGTESKYLTNLLIAGRNFLEIFAIFQHSFNMSMGSYRIYESIEQISQWDKNIVVQAGVDKVIGFIYEDYIIKNSFMFSLSFFDLAPNQKINIVCDRFGYYLAIATSREFILCVSQKAIQKYKSKPLFNRQYTIVSEDIKWNRLDYQSISDVIRIEYDDLDISKVQSLSFCDDKLYFIGHSSKNNHEKSVFFISAGNIFSDDENKPIVISLQQKFCAVKQIYPIHRGKEVQFLVIQEDKSIELQSSKGNIIIENSNKFKSQNNQQGDFQIHCKHQNVFPFYILFNQSLYVYRRDAVSLSEGTITTASQIYKSQVKLPQTLHINLFDIKDHFFAYCNNYEAAFLNLQQIKQGGQNNSHNKDQQINKIVLKESFGRIIDFSIGRNCIVIENYHKKLCRINLLSKSIRQDPRPFVIHAKKNALESLPKIRSIKSLIDYVALQQLQSQVAYKNIQSSFSELMVISHSDSVYNLYRLNEKGECQCLLPNFNFHKIILTKQISLDDQAYMLIVWYQDKSQLSFFKILNNQIELIKSIRNINFDSVKSIKHVRQYLVEYNNELCFKFYNMKTEEQFQIKLSNEKINSKCQVQITPKKITFKKKDKDFFFCEISAITATNCLYIWEISISTQQFKLSHKTEDISEGLPVLFNSTQAAKNISHNPTTIISHRFRSITCPQYLLSASNLSSSLCTKVLGMQIYEYKEKTYLFLINSNKTLQMYKKIYTSQNISGASSNILNHSDIGFLWHRVPIQLDILKKWEYDANKVFIDLGCNILRICNYAFYKNQLFQIPEEIVSCFQMDGQIWFVESNGKIRMLITKGKIVSHFLVSQIKSDINQEILGIQSTNQIYVFYSRSSFQVFNKELMRIWKVSQSQFGNKQLIISLCAFDHYIAVSYYNYAQDQEDPKEYQSIKFKFRIYNSMIKNKIIEKQPALEEPAIFIRDIPPDKLLLVTPSNIFVYQIKNQRTLETFRHKNYTKRGMLSSFGYIPEKIGIEPGYMIFGGLYGGFSFMFGKWIDKEKIDEIWFQSLKCGIKQLQIFHYGLERDYLKAIVADNQCNLMIFDIQPKKAVKIADYHLGSSILKIKKRNGVPYIGSEDGCISIIVPMKLKNIEISFLDFQEEIIKEIPFLGGLNSRDGRCLQQRFRTYKITSKGDILDSALIQDFMALTQTLQNHIFDKIDMELDDLKSAIFAEV